MAYVLFDNIRLLLISSTT